MREVVDLIEAKKQLLAKNKLFRFLSDESIDPHERLSFAPSMLYYLMGFKDVLSELYVQNPGGDIEKAINAYCGEDAEHWRWYLDDLDKLGFTLNSWGASIPQFCNEVWSADTEINRKTIFSLINYAQRSKDPLFKMVLIQIFEATGVIFIGHTRKAAMAMGMDDELLYFGKVHFEEEFGHSVQSSQLLHYSLPEETRALAIEAVENLSAQYDELFGCWHDHKNRYRFSCEAHA